MLHYFSPYCFCRKCAVSNAWEFGAFGNDAASLGAHTWERLCSSHEEQKQVLHQKVGLSFELFTFCTPELESIVHYVHRWTHITDTGKNGSCCLLLLWLIQQYSCNSPLHSSTSRAVKLVNSGCLQSFYCNKALLKNLMMLMNLELQFPHVATKLSVSRRLRLNWPEGAAHRKSVSAVQKLASLRKLLQDLGDHSVSFWPQGPSIAFSPKNKGLIVCVLSWLKSIDGTLSSVCEKYCSRVLGSKP